MGVSSDRLTALPLLPPFPSLQKRRHGTRAARPLTMFKQLNLLKWQIDDNFLA